MRLRIDRWIKVRPDEVNDYRAQHRQAEGEFVVSCDIPTKGMEPWPAPLDQESNPDLQARHAIAQALVGSQQGNTAPSSAPSL